MGVVVVAVWLVLNASIMIARMYVSSSPLQLKCLLFRATVKVMSSASASDSMRLSGIVFAFNVDRQRVSVFTALELWMHLDLVKCEVLTTCFGCASCFASIRHRM